MTRELISRGGNIAHIRSSKWREQLAEDENENVKHVLKQIDNIVEQGTDRPTLSDNLGRSAYANGLAALFLNPFVKSPITVGISGEWGMGKSSVMMQERNPLSDMLSNYQPEYHQVFKSLAVMDRREMFEKDENKEESRSGDVQVPLEKDIMQGSSIPSILTVRYNAWQYRNESEAWAGLAVEITKELEATMTVAEKLRTSWKYNWQNHKRDICVGVFLPCILAVFLALWLTGIVWIVLDQVNIRNAKELQYGSFPVTVLVSVWAIVRSVMSVVKPISSQMVEYICLPDHSEKLGYHQKVIKDIKFLKSELGHRASWLWKTFGFMWCCITWSWDDNYVAGTRIPKMTPASNDNLRMVVFVDDLDRCQENVILQMIERAIIRMFGDKNNKPNESSQDLADKYLRKIIQLPLDLPDPSPSESKLFLEGQLGMSDTKKRASGSQTETQTQTVAAHKKLNPKFRRVPSEDSRRGTASPRGGVVNPHLSKKLERMDTLIESLDQDTEIKEEKDHISDATGERIISHLSTKKKHKETIQESGKETKIIIQDSEVTRLERNPKGGRTSARTYVNLAASYTKKFMISLWSCIMKLMSSLRSKQAENTEFEEQLMAMSPITHEMIIPKYSEGERDAFYFLQTHTTGSTKLPREWKRLLTYHRLAWNILSKSEPVKKLVGWQVQLISWVFVCWQWKRLINTIIQEWQELNVLKNWMAVHDDRQDDMVHEITNGPSLREIVEHYIDDRWPKHNNSSSVSASEQVNPAKPKEQSICIGDENPVNGFVQEKSIIRSTSTSSSGFTSTSKEEDLKELVRQVVKEEREQERREYLLKHGEHQGRRNKKGKRKPRQQEPDDELKIMVREVLQEQEVEDWLKVILKNVLKEEKEQENRQKGRTEDFEKGKRGGGDPNKQKALEKGRRKVEIEEEKERREWEKLRETLSRYNVTMDGIQAFQNFRFNCVAGHLPWPLHKP
ncbi:hypothetical protein KI387_022787 [Taxus chinensis]|uniref:KAP NTPase domain-containing protein n=1 Tax=Taxus chinensis TaxID=29808 RepID=A0AA38G1G4_TAXCH|nr:hypothetical protein KI387_022787 [Taxus chinensis]